MSTTVTTDSPLNIGPSDPPWKAFEKAVANLTAKLNSLPSDVKWNEKLSGVHSGVPRQVDVYLQGDVNGIPIAVAIECKRYGRPIDVGEIDAFVGKLNGLDVDKGVFYVHDGVTPGARQRAEKALHPKVLLREFASALLDSSWDDLVGPDCPTGYCQGYVEWVEYKQPAGGADVRGGVCTSCGAFSIECRDCEEVEPAEVGKFTCFCEAEYAISPDHYQSSEVGNVEQTKRGAD